ncbi:flagellar protein FliO/FliZ [Blastococcus aurantiacus]|uniref:Flagellar protein FliO/FliZ n=1 Tax=Blastococcus aurantiacus TaxID=1550231 RepID=A0A1G7JM49_9ACTN|nr:flagellar biosynthetic protein FliO [Blastococcus aurantiacus]SDF25983.1 flagellar protein FliO/FliZ [Blastococcus aurantiacus]
MTWMIIRLILSLAFIGGVLLFAARLAKKRGLGQGNGLIEVVARHRLGRTSTLNVVRIADVVLVVGATEEQVTLLAEIDSDSIDDALHERTPVRQLPSATHDDDLGRHHDDLGRHHDEHLDPRHELDRGPRVARPSTGALAGSVLDRQGWGNLVDQMRERTVRRP